jgi:hypothetical protein
MVLSSRFFEPFDQTYSEVTAVMRRSADGFAATRERDWLTRLIKEFQNERDAWPTIPSLAAYRDACARVRPRFLRLIVCAYLHISYDLPRVIADNWPGQDDWAAGPFEDRGEHIYFDLEPVFPDVLGQIAGRWSVMGGYSVVLRFVSRNLLRASSHWLLRLREAAWRHARTLSSSPTTSGDEPRSECVAR